VRVLVFVLAMMVFALVGCQQAQEQAEETSPATEEMATPAAGEGAMMDPVCGMEVTADSEWTAEYEGVTYYFCSEACRDKFLEDPMAYMKQPAEESMEEAKDMAKDMGTS